MYICVCVRVLCSHRSEGGSNFIVNFKLKTSGASQYLIHSRSYSHSICKCGWICRYAHNLSYHQCTSVKIEIIFEMGIKVGMFLLFFCNSCAITGFTATKEKIGIDFDILISYAHILPLPGIPPGNATLISNGISHPTWKGCLMNLIQRKLFTSKRNSVFIICIWHNGINFIEAQVF